MSRLMLAGIAAIGFAVVAPQAPVLAQNGPQADSSITVSAPTLRQMERAGDTRSVIPDRMLVSQTVVYTGDLNLRTQAGRDALDSRVRVAAEQSCDRIEQADPPSALSGGMYSDCVYNAVQRSQQQVYAAIWSA